MATTTTNSAKVGSFFRKVGRFLLHFGEMCLGMCAGAVILSFAFFGGAALIGYPDLISQAPAFSTLALAINFTLPMVGWMRFRGHGWRPTLEMGGTSMVLGIVLIAAGWVGLIPVGNIFGLEASLCCPAMLVPMLFRLGLYTEGHHAHGS
ncbi:MAG: hypothetical protein M3305_06770 [Actinomycetota bacterium]|nr:hypothetical protein [Actinomycetota bacterium]